MYYNRLEQFQSEKQEKQFCKEQKCYVLVHGIGRRRNPHQI